MDRSDNVPMVVDTIKIRVANKKGYQECEVGGVFDYNQSTSKTRRGRVIERGKVSGTIMATEDKAVYEGGKYRIRKLTPRECWRLMDFDDEDFDKAAEHCSNTQLYKQAGNSVCVSVIRRIAENIEKAYNAK